MGMNNQAQPRPPMNQQQGMARPPQPVPNQQNPQQQQQLQRQQQAAAAAAAAPNGQPRPPMQHTNSFGNNAQSPSAPRSNGAQASLTPEQQNMIGQIYRAVETVGKRCKEIEAAVQASQNPQEKEALQKQWKEEQVKYNTLVNKMMACKEQFLKQHATQMASGASPGPSGAASNSSPAQQAQQQLQGAPRGPSGAQQQQQQQPQRPQQQTSARPSPAPGTPGGASGGASTPGATAAAAAQAQQQQQQQSGTGGSSGIAPGSTASSMLVNQSRLDPSNASPAASGGASQGIRPNATQSSSNTYTSSTAASSSVPGQATISSNLPPQTPQPFPNTQGPRPTLSMGLAGGPGSAITSTPGILAHPQHNSGLGNLFALGAAASEASRTGSNAANGATGGAGGGGANGATPGGSGAGGSSSLPATSSSNAMMTAALGEKNGRMLTKRKIQELVGELDMEEVLEEDVEDVSCA